MKPFSVEIICPLHPGMKHKIFFEPMPLSNEYYCIGCDEFRDSNPRCMQCRNDMQKSHGGVPRIDKQLREIFQAAHEK
ncbi:MAG: hypothetical protein IKW21_06620 [Lachnospiraceae bacterium]|nr:hypothetical protein [Lachnospiraceae bacterium]